MQEPAFPPTFNSTLKAILEAFPDFKHTIKLDMLAERTDLKLKGRYPDKTPSFKEFADLYSEAIIQTPDPDIIVEHQNTDGELFITRLASFIIDFLNVFNTKTEKMVNLHALFEQLCIKWELDMHAVERGMCKSELVELYQLTDS